MKPQKHTGMKYYVTVFLMERYKREIRQCNMNAKFSECLNLAGEVEEINPEHWYNCVGHVRNLEQM